jgi:predicted DNA-binding mobile mystery protein A
MNKKKLVREQLDRSLQRLSPMRDVTPPQRGWIRAIRDALGMTAKQLANRLGVSQQSVARIERDELAGAITIKTMRRVAACLDCVFVYGFVPRMSLEDTVAKQAKQLAIKRVARVHGTMSLENQALSSAENERVLADLIDDLMTTTPSALWDKP